MSTVMGDPGRNPGLRRRAVRLDSTTFAETVPHQPPANMLEQCALATGYADRRMPWN